jgi:hypothetical protein
VGPNPTLSAVRAKGAAYTGTPHLSTVYSGRYPALHEDQLLIRPLDYRSRNLFGLILRVLLPGSVPVWRFALGADARFLVLLAWQPGMPTALAYPRPDLDPGHTLQYWGIGMCCQVSSL